MNSTTEINQQSCASMTAYLLTKYGSVMRYQDVALELRVTNDALRQREHRHKDLPPTLLGTRHKTWATPVVAAWLLGLHAHGVIAFDEVSGHKRRPGRPRKSRVGGSP